MECEFCHEDKKLVDAHIIPRCFFEAMRNKKDNKPFQLLSNTVGEYPKRSQIGLYDNSILCEECERKIFKKLDDYACKILLSDIENKKHFVDNKKVGYYKLRNVDYGKIKLFFLSILWRAAVSKRKEFKRVKLGPFKESLRMMLKKFNPGDVNDFLVVLRRFTDNLGKNFLMDPYQLRLNGIIFYRFYLGAGYEFHIKVSKINLEKSNSLYPVALKPNGFLHIPFRSDLLKSKEFPILKNILKTN